MSSAFFVPSHRKLIFFDFFFFGTAALLSVMNRYGTWSVSFKARVGRRIADQSGPFRSPSNSGVRKKAERDHSYWQQLSRCHLRRADEEYEMYQLIFPWSL